MSKGRGLKYGEPTKMFRQRVPESKFASIDKLVKDELKNYEVKRGSDRDSETEKPENSGKDC